MAFRRLQLTNIQNVAASKTAIIELPQGNVRLHDMQLNHGYSSGTNTVAAAATNVSEIRIKRNGKQYYQFSGTELRDYNLLQGDGASYDFTGVPNTSPGVNIPIYFAEPWRQDEEDQLATAIVVNGARWTVEVDLSTASTPTLTGCVAVEDFVYQGDPSRILYKKIVRDSLAAGGTKFSVPGFVLRDLLQQVTVYPESGGGTQCTKLTMKIDGADIHDLTAAMNTAFNIQHRMTPTASGRTGSMYDLMLDHDGLLQHAVDLNGVRNFLLQLEFASSSGSVTYLCQRIGPAE